MVDDRITKFKCKECGGILRLIGRKKFGVLVCQSCKSTFLVDRDYGGFVGVE
jgi:ribosomal protein L37AE/L43A